MSELTNWKVNGIDFMVEVNSLKEQVDVCLQYDPSVSRKQILGNLHMLGGFRVAYITQEQLDHLASAEMDVAGYREGYVVTITEEFADGMTPREIEAVLYHEAGHIVHGDLQREPTDVGGGVMVVLDEEIELRADAFAVEHGFGMELISGITKTVKNVEKSLNKLTGKDASGYVQETLSALEPRFAAIRAALI